MESQTIISDLLDALNKRGVMSGLYIASVIVALIMSYPGAQLAADPNAWVLFVGVLVIGLIVASVTFEMLVPLFQLATSPIVLRRFQATVGGKIRDQIRDYNALRKFRESFLASSGSEHLKERITRDENIRILLTYLGSGSIANYALIVGAMIVVPQIPAQVSRLLLIFTSYVFIGTLIGEVTRSASYGTSLAMAYLQNDRPSGSQ